MGVIEIVKKQEREKGKREGILEGIQEAKKDIVQNLIGRLSLSDEEISRIADVTIDYVRQIRAAIAHK